MQQSIRFIVVSFSLLPLYSVSKEKLVEIEIAIKNYLEMDPIVESYKYFQYNLEIYIYMII